MTDSPLEAALTESSAEKYILPEAAPGPAGRPLPIFVALRSAARSKIGAKRWLKSSAGIRRMASSFVMSLSFTMSRAILTAAKPVRLPLRVCNIHNLPSSTVNSTSCTSRKCFSRILRTLRSSLCDFGRSFTILAIGFGVRTPATTSSP